jgi:hypothetical protein
VTLACTRCGAPVGPSDINPHTSIARCGACAHAFAAPRPAPNDADDGPVVALAPGPPPAPPTPALDVIEGAAPAALAAGYRHAFGEEGELVIRQKWGPPHERARVAFSFTAVVAFLARSGASWLEVGVWGAAMMFVALQLVVSFGPPVAVDFVRRLTARATVRATPCGRLALRGPLPWARERAFAAGDVRSIACGGPPSSALFGRARERFVIRANLYDGRSIVLFAGLPDRDEALAVAARLERYLGLPGAGAAGELGSRALG